MRRMLRADIDNIQTIKSLRGMKARGEHDACADEIFVFLIEVGIRMDGLSVLS